MPTPQVSSASTEGSFVGCYPHGSILISKVWSLQLSQCDSFGDTASRTDRHIKRVRCGKISRMLTSKKNVIIVALCITVVIAISLALFSKHAEKTQLSARQFMTCELLWIETHNNDAAIYLPRTREVLELKHARPYIMYGRAYQSINFLNSHVPPISDRPASISWVHKMTYDYHQESRVCVSLYRLSSNLSIHPIGL